jgi:hypothetical protein
LYGCHPSGPNPRVQLPVLPVIVWHSERERCLVVFRPLEPQPPRSQGFRLPEGSRRGQYSTKQAAPKQKCFLGWPARSHTVCTRACKGPQHAVGGYWIEYLRLLLLMSSHCRVEVTELSTNKQHSLSPCARTVQPEPPEPDPPEPDPPKPDPPEPDPPLRDLMYVSLHT